MKVKIEPTPTTENIETALPKLDFADTIATTNHKDALETVAKLIFAQFPGWVGKLFTLRNGLVKCFGLKVTKPDDYTEEFRIGGYVGFFRIYAIESDEILLGADDKHLNFRVSVLDSKQKDFNIKVTTLVKFNNRFGRIYMAIIKPIHVWVVKSMVKQAYKA